VDVPGRSRREALRKWLYLTAIALAITVLWFIASIVMVSRETKVIREAAAKERRLGEARLRLQNILIFLSNAETGQRGYLLAEKDSYLSPYNSAISGIAGLLDELERSTVDVPSRAPLIGHIREQTNLKLAELADTIRLARAGNRAAAIALVQTDRGQEIMERLRADIDAFNSTLLTQERASTDAVAQTVSHREQLAILASVALLLAFALATVQVILLFAAQHRYELALSLSERRHRALVEEQSEVVTLVRPDGGLVYANPAFSRMFDVPVDQIDGRHLLDWITLADRGLMQQSLQDALLAIEPVAIACGVECQGEERWLSWTLHAQVSEGARLVHAVGRDVTLRRKAEAALRISEDFLQRTNRVAGVGGWELHLATGELSWSDQVRRIHEVADDYLPTLESATAFYAPEAQVQLRAAMDGARFQGTPWDLELALTPTSGHPIYVRTVGAVERDQNGVPIRLIGTLQDVTDRKRLELKLEAKERFISGITDSLPARIAYVGADRRFQFVNRKLADRFNLPAEKIVGADILDMATPDSRAGWEEVVTAALAGQSPRYDYDDTIDGELHTIEAHLIPDTTQSGQVQGFVSISTDITHLKRVEQHLRELTDVFDNTTDFVAQADWRGKVLYINKSARRALGIAADTPLVDCSFREFYPPETNERFAREIVPAVKRDLVWVGETGVLLHGGRVVPVNHMVIGHLDAQGRVSRYSSIMRDISAEVAARRELARQTATLNTIIEAIPAMVAVFDLDARIVLVNQAYERWRGLSRDLLIGRLVEEAMDPAEFASSEPWARRALAGETVCYEKEYPQAPEIRHVQLTYIPLRMPDGAISGFFGVAQDITQHREENIRLALLSMRDPLTRVLNRAGFEQLIQSKVGDGLGATLAVIYIDLDHFKPVNDTHGHAAGDKVLQEFSARLERLLRPTDAVARLGGDEFAVILLDIRKVADAAKVAGKIVAVAQQPFPINRNSSVTISASVGVACDADAAGGWKALIAQADHMAYQAKRAGGGRLAVAPTPGGGPRRMSNG
jgi:diguanylate cyclase (GGDEF)-like protein/PAS domain S-box-containing protein